MTRCTPSRLLLQALTTLAPARLAGQAPPLPAQSLVHPEKQVAQRGLAHPGGSQQQDVQAGAQAAVDI